MSVVSAKLYSSNLELVFEKPLVLEDTVGPSGNYGGCVYMGGEDCVPGWYNDCAEFIVDDHCSSETPGAPS